MQKRWLINKKYPQEFAEKFPEFSPIILQLLWDRKLKNQTRIDEFFNPDYDQDLHNPFLMKDMDKAVERILEAIREDEKILVYGDYDVDGVTSAVIMATVLAGLKSAVVKIKKGETRNFIDIYIPDRELEGYGLNQKAIKEIKRRKINLIITVDCGISNFESVALAEKLGIDVIITDHHHVLEKIPKALAVINPRQKDCSYPFKELSGAGVAFKVAQALIQGLKNSDFQNGKQIPCPASRQTNSLSCQQANSKLLPGFEKWLLDLVTLGTIADCVNLGGENRTLVKYGLLVINKTKRTGLKKLISMAGFKVRENGSMIEKKIIDANMISFILAPRINAAGRIDHANTSYKLLMTESENEAEELALKLEKNNQKRQQLTDKMISEIKDRISKYKKLPKIIVESDPKWKIGIVGLVAGKLADEYGRPFLILQNKGEESAGSGRSVSQFNLIEAIEKCKDILIEFGGHSQAAGLKIKNRNFKKFKEKINAIAGEALKEEDLAPSIAIDCKIKPEEISWRLFDEIEKFHPFGEGNEKPVFLAEKLEIHEVRAVGNGNSHLKLCFKSILNDGKIKYFSAIGFRLGNLTEEMPSGGPGLRWGDIVDVVFQLEVNEWNGNRELQMNVLDLKISE